MDERIAPLLICTLIETPVEVMVIHERVNQKIIPPEFSRKRRLA